MTRRIVISLIVAFLLSTGMLVGETSFAAEKKIAVIWVGKSGMTHRVARAFLLRLKEIAPDVKVTFRPEQKSMAVAEKQFRELEKTMDGILFLRSTGAKFLGSANPQVPCFVGGCNNPQRLGAIENLETPEGKITGVTYFVPYDKRFQAIKALFPNVKSVGLLMERGHPGAPIDQQGTREQCEKLGIEYHEAFASNVDELVKAAEDLTPKADVLIMASNKMVFDNTPSLVKVSKAKKVPLFAYSEAPVKMGALSGLAARDDYLGRVLADSVVDVVVKGKPVSEVPVKTDPDPRIQLNEEGIAFFDLKIPPNVMGRAVVHKRM